MPTGFPQSGQTHGPDYLLDYGKPEAVGVLSPARLEDKDRFALGSAEGAHQPVHLIGAARVAAGLSPTSKSPFSLTAFAVPAKKFPCFGLMNSLFCTQGISTSKPQNPVDSGYPEGPNSSRKIGISL